MNNFHFQLKNSTFFNSELSSDSVQLCLLTEDHSEDILRLFSSYETIKYTDNFLHINRTDSKAYIAETIDKRNRKRSMYWGIQNVGCREVIGVISVYNINCKHSFASVGNLLLPEYWRKGLTFSAYQLVIKSVFRDLKINRLEAQVFVEHIASVNLFLKLGFTREGLLRENFLINGHLEDSILLAKLKKDDKG